MATQTQPAPMRRAPIFVRWLLVGGWTCFIWSRSLFTGPESSGQSAAVVALLEPVMTATGITDVDLVTFAVRKLAHFSEYFLLGVLLSLTRKPGSSLWPRIAYGLAVPGADEALQLFVAGRSGQLRDVSIDACGMACGLAVATRLRVIWHRRHLSCQR